MKFYMKYAIWDCFFCVLALAGLTRNIYNGYNMTDYFSGNMKWILLFSIIIEGICFLMDYDDLTQKIGILITLICIVVFIIYNQVFHPFLHEREMSYAVFWIYLIGIGAVLFYIHKVRWGIILYLLIGNLITAAAVFLHFGLSLAGYFCFLIGTIGILLYHFYLDEITEAFAIRMQNVRYTMQSLLLCFIALLLSLLLVYGILIPLSLPTRELKLIQKLESMEIIHKVGVSALLPDVDPAENASGETEDQITGNGESSSSENQKQDKNQGQNQSNQEYQHNQSNSDSQDTSGQQIEQNKNENQKKEEKAIDYQKKNYLLLFIIIVVILSVIGSIIYKKKQRIIFLKELNEMPRQKAVLLCYNYFNRTLSLVQVRKSQNLTLHEYSRMRKKDTDPYICGEHDFRDLTNVYEKVIYGHADVTLEEWSWFQEAYIHYPENLREEMGFLRYTLLFFRI